MNNKVSKIEEERDCAISSLEEICFITTTLFFSRKKICDLAAEIYKKPNSITFPYNRDLLLDNFKTIEKQNPNLFTESGFGDFSNKMVMVNSASILENYLRNAGKLFELNEEKIDPCPECGHRKRSLPHSFDGIVKRFKHRIDLTTIKGYEQSYLLTIIRHKIIHRRGKIDDTFKKQVKKLTCKESKLFVDKEVGTIVPTPIDETILPCLEKSVEFVKESSDRFVSVLKNNDVSQSKIN